MQKLFSLFRWLPLLQALFKEYVCEYLKHLFPRLVSYNCFVELEKKVLLSLNFHQESPVGDLYWNQFY